MKIAPINLGISRWILLSLCIFANCTGFVRAQTLTNATGTEGFSIPSLLESDHLASDIPGRKELADSHGITFSGQLINDMLWNTLGGASAGNADDGVLQIGLDADMKKLIGLEGGTFHTSWLWTYGSNINGNVANAFSVSAFSANPAFRCYELWYQQSFAGSLVSLRGGLLAIDNEFTLSDTAGLFVNSSFGLANLGTFNLANSGPQFPMATPGVRLEVDPTDWLMLHTVFAQANPFTQQQNQNNFNWNFGPSGGLLNVTEAVAKWKSILSSQLPGTAKAGFWIQNGPAPTLPDSYELAAPGNVQYSTGFYAVADQALYRPHGNGHGDSFPAVGDAVVPEPSDSAPQGLNAFGRVGFTPQPDNPMSLFADGDLVYTGLIPGRKADRLGAAFAYGQVSSGYRSLAAQQDIPGASFEAVSELTYSIQVTPAVTLQPDLQYVLHPGGTQQYGNALVAGFRATVAF